VVLECCGTNCPFFVHGLPKGANLCGFGALVVGSEGAFCGVRGRIHYELNRFNDIFLCEMR
jgi:hypothetical protein